MKILSLILGTFCFILLFTANEPVHRAEATIADDDPFCKSGCEKEMMELLHYYIEWQMISTLVKNDPNTESKSRGRKIKLEKKICFSKENYIKDKIKGVDIICEKFKKNKKKVKKQVND